MLILIYLHLIAQVNRFIVITVKINNQLLEIQNRNYPSIILSLFKRCFISHVEGNNFLL